MGWISCGVQGASPSTDQVAAEKKILRLSYLMAIIIDCKSSNCILVVMSDQLVSGEEVLETSVILCLWNCFDVFLWCDPCLPSSSDDIRHGGGNVYMYLVNKNKKLFCAYNKGLS